MSNKALFFTALVASVVFLGGMTIPETCLAQSHASNNTKNNKQDMSPGADQQNSTKQSQGYKSPGGVNADQKNSTKQGQGYSSPGSNTEQQGQNKQEQGYKPVGVNTQQQGQSKQGQGYMTPGGVTADQQSENQQDRELTQKIRQAVMKDKDLSMNAHNVKIITVDGMVTLKGPVESEQEKKAIEELATEAAGKDKIKSEITIAP